MNSIDHVLMEIRRIAHNHFQKESKKGVIATKQYEYTYTVKPMVIKIKRLPKKDYALVITSGVFVDYNGSEYLFSTSTRYSTPINPPIPNEYNPLVYRFHEFYLHVPDLFLYISVYNKLPTKIYNNNAIGVLSHGRFYVYLTDEEFLPYYYSPDYKPETVKLPNNLFQVLRLIGETDVYNKLPKQPVTRTITEFLTGVPVPEQHKTGISKNELHCMLIYFILPTIYFSFFETTKKTLADPSFIRSEAEEILKELPEGDKHELKEYVKSIIKGKIKPRLNEEIVLEFKG